MTRHNQFQFLKDVFFLVSVIYNCVLKRLSASLSLKSEQENGKNFESKNFRLTFFARVADASGVRMFSV